MLLILHDGKGEIMDLIRYFKKEIIPAFGCTEPIALAFTAAKAADMLGEMPEKVFIRCSGNMIKNAKSVVIPNSGGKKGIEYSVILGVLAGHPERNLEILESITEDQIKEAESLYDRHYCQVDFVPDVPNLYIEAKAVKGDHYGLATVEHAHTNIIRLEKDGEVLLNKDAGSEGDLDFTADFQEIYNFARTGDISPILDTLKLEIQYNMAIAEEGLTHPWGANIGKMILAEGDDFGRRKQAWAAAGSDARMSGCSMPVIINSGSGNQGITMSVPVILEARHMGAGEEALYRALTFGNLIGLYLKSGIGKLSAYCGAMCAASAGAAAIAFLHGEKEDIIKGTLTNALAALSGVICDGAKPSCALKIATAVGTGEIAYRQAKAGNTFQPGDGIVKGDIDKTVRAVAHIARDGMRETDHVILREMLQDC